MILLEYKHKKKLNARSSRTFKLLLKPQNESLASPVSQLLVKALIYRARMHLRVYCVYVIIFFLIIMPFGKTIKGVVSYIDMENDFDIEIYALDVFIK